MDIYFDQANFESYVKTYHSNKTQYEEHNKMLKKHLDVFLNMTAAQFSASKICMAWLNAFAMQGGGKQPRCIGRKPFLPRSVKLMNSDHLNVSGEQHSHVYCLDRKDIQTFSAKGNYLIGGVGDEMKLIDSLLFANGQYTQSLPIRKHFNTPVPWSVLYGYSLPCTDLIIADSYVLGNASLYQQNIYLLITTLLDKPINTHVNIVLFVFEQTESKAKKDADGNPNTVVYYPKWNDIRQMIQLILRSKHVTANVSFVALKDSKDFGQHDRNILANYLFYNSGATLNYYDKDGKFTSRGSDFFVQSLALKDNFDYVFGNDDFCFVKSLQKIIDDIKSGTRSGQLLLEPKPKPTSVLSNYLTF